MCGIAGYIGEIENETAITVVKSMISDLARRGPDGEGLECWPGAVLGHRRLAIFDLTDAGKQPMRSPDGRIGIVFNGSIYNYRELRSDLVSRGWRFRSDTDTEVLILGYLEWGLDKLLRQLNGMFAFGLWDSTCRKLYLVRDRLGVKPLCYLVSGKTIAFASTPRALRSAGLVDQLDPQGIQAFLDRGYVPDQLCVYESVKKVPAATVIEWDGNLASRKYWELPTLDHQVNVTFQDAVDETERLLLNAVRRRLYAHVPVGVLLSGGVDSALVSWAVSQSGGDITAYTLGVPGDPRDETSAATETAKVLGLSHEILQISDHGEAEAEKLAEAYAEPFAAASGLGMLKISEAAANAVTVLLTGDGGDDVFLGYPRHRHLYAAGKVPPWIRPIWGMAWDPLRQAFPRKGLLRRVAAFADYASGNLDAFFDSSLWVHDPHLRSLLGERLAGRDYVSPRFASMGNKPLASLLTHEYAFRFVGEYLTKVDGATMHHAIEARSPFLDQNLWEFAGALPYDLRLHRGKLKAILRAIVRRRVGTATATRRKTGFEIPVQRWILGRWRTHIRSAFQDSELQREGWVNAEHALQLLERPELPKDYLDYLWRSYILELWFRRERLCSKVLTSAVY